MSKNKIFHFMTILLLAGIFFLYSYNLTGWLMHDDEGEYLYQAWRMTEGEVPYKDFYAPEGPLFLFTGYLIFKLFGPAVFWARMFSVLATILTGYLIFLIGRRVYNYTIGLLGAVFYLILPVVFFQARLFRSDAYAVLFSTLGLFLFIRAWQEKRRSLFAWAGAVYAFASGYKLLALLGLAGLLFFMIYEVTSQRKFAVIKHALIPFVAGFTAALAGILLVVWRISPSFLTCVVTYHFDQPTLYAPNIFNTIFANIKDFFMVNARRHGIRDTHAWLIILSLPLAIRYLLKNEGAKAIFSFYIFNIIWLFFSPYDESPRYLLFFLPAAVLLFSAIVSYPFRKKGKAVFKAMGLLALVFSIMTVFIPGLRKDYVRACAKENGTLALAGYIRNNTSENDYVVADYGDMLFYAGRKTTPFAAGLSEAAVRRKCITSDTMIRELKGYNVKLVVIHERGGIGEGISLFFGTPFRPHHLSTLINSEDGLKFMDYLKKNYRRKADFNREGQEFAIYIRKD